MLTPDYKERVVEHLANMAFWAFKDTSATHEEIIAFVKDSTVAEGTDDSFLDEVIARYKFIVSRESNNPI